jgi:hypothetical protein
MSGESRRAQEERDLGRCNLRFALGSVDLCLLLADLSKCADYNKTPEARLTATLPALEVKLKQTAYFRGRFVPGFAGVVVVVAGVVGFGLAVVPVFEAVLVPGAGVPVVDPDAPLPDAGVAAGAETGSEVNGVGSGGKGFERIPATSASIPATESLLRNLYH